MYADYAALNQTPGVAPGPPLGLPADARTVVVKDGTVDVREGPHGGSNGAVGGFLVLEADDLDAAVAVASRIPAQPRLGGAIEVRHREVLVARLAPRPPGSRGAEDATCSP